MFAIYAYLKVSINFDEQSDEYGYCYRKLSTIIKNTGLAKATVEKEIKVLQETGVIIYGNCGTHTKNGFIKTDSNIYMMNYEGNMAKLNEFIGVRAEELRNEGWKMQAN